MQQATIGTRYQIVIPKEIRKKVKGFQPGTKVAVTSHDDNVITVKPVNQNWVDETYGKFKKHLQGTAEEVEKMRDEWEERVKGLEKSTT